LEFQRKNCKDFTVHIPTISSRRLSNLKSRKLEYQWKTIYSKPSILTHPTLKRCNSNHATIAIKGKEGIYLKSEAVLSLTAAAGKKIILGKNIFIRFKTIGADPETISST
jgi:hypothetical protein